MKTLEESLQESADSRPLLEVKISDVLPRAKREGTFAIRDLVSAEILDATADAMARRKAVLTSLPPQYVHIFLDDPKFLADSQTVEELARAVRCADDPSKPAFASADAMHKCMTRDELATLYAYFEKARGQSGEVTYVDQSVADSVVIAAQVDPEALAARLMRCAPHILSELVVTLAVREAALKAMMAETAT